MATRTADLTSQVDGVVKLFTLPESFDVGTLEVYLNGVRLLKGVGTSGDFVETGTAQFTFNAGCPAPAGADTLQAQYEVSSLGDPVIFPTVVASGHDPTGAC